MDAVLLQTQVVVVTQHFMLHDVMKVSSDGNKVKETKISRYLV